MMREGRDYAGIAPNVVVKVPLTRDGLRACKALSSDGIKTNVTLVFSAPQALLAAKAGASFVSPFVGRLDDIGQDGMELISEIADIYANFDFKTEILVASVRHPIHIARACAPRRRRRDDALQGDRAALKHPLTDIGLEKFLKDWETTQGARK
jgi:transaldolase